MNGVEQMAEVFTILHDGTIEDWEGDKALLTLKISCVYLAERINPSFANFYIDLYDINKIELEPWLDEFANTPIIITDLKAIFNAKLEIMQGDMQNDAVLITCYQHDKSFNYTGGNLYVGCAEAKIYDHNKSELSINSLGDICKGYWDSFGKNK
jgi:hypothetical protein